MPTKLNTDALALHLEVLNRKLARLKGLMNISNGLLHMDNETLETPIDKEAEKLHHEELAKDYVALEDELIAYEDLVLEKTKI
jgi:hypothetical protein